MNPLLKTLIWILALTLLGQCNKDEPGNVNIPDNTFLNLLIQKGIDTNGDGAISHQEAAAVRSLNIDNTGVSDLTGIGSFVNLDTLMCGANWLTSIVLSGNKHLVFLDCSTNQLTSLDVSNNTALTYLACHHNPLANLNVSANKSLK